MYSLQFFFVKSVTFHLRFLFQRLLVRPTRSLIKFVHKPFLRLQISNLIGLSGNFRDETREDREADVSTSTAVCVCLEYVRAYCCGCSGIEDSCSLLHERRNVLLFNTAFMATPPKSSSDWFT